MSRRKGKVKIGAELTVEANRYAKALSELEDPLVVAKVGRFDGFRFVIYSDRDGISSSEVMLAHARRIEELKRRGYPQEWIEKDLEKLTGIL